jgi:hypothetical protein
MQFFIVMLQINIYQENSLTIAVYYSSISSISQKNTFSAALVFTDNTKDE